MVWSVYHALLFSRIRILVMRNSLWFVRTFILFLLFQKTKRDRLGLLQRKEWLREKDSGGGGGSISRYRSLNRTAKASRWCCDYWWLSLVQSRCFSLLSPLSSLLSSLFSFLSSLSSLLSVLLLSPLSSLHIYTLFFGMYQNRSLKIMSHIEHTAGPTSVASFINQAVFHLLALDILREERGERWGERGERRGDKSSVWHSQRGEEVNRDGINWTGLGTVLQYYRLVVYMQKLRMVMAYFSLVSVELMLGLKEYMHRVI